ncbi:MAG: LCP family protein [Lachnospiraceae bacterium]
MAKRRAKRRGRRKPKRGFASWSIGKKIAAIFGGTVVIVATAGVVLLASKLGKIDNQVLDTKKLNITEEVEEKLTGYTNVALFGVDSREGELGKDTRSDTIMIASLNNETKEVKLASVFRDTLMEQSDGTYNKANAAYSFGGPEEAVAMLNKNLDLDITKYVTVNFNAMVSVIDAIGGIDIDVSSEEVDYITGYSCEIIESTGIDSEGVFEPGLQTLNGTQATAYARIRYTAGDDFKRAERQRSVLEKIIAKAQNAKLSVINKIVDDVFPQVSTNFTLPELLGYAKYASKYKLAPSTGFPIDKTTDTLSGIGSIVIPQTLESNAIELHKYLFGEDGYVPSSKLTKVSNGIAYRAATGAKAAPEEVEQNYYDNTTTTPNNNQNNNQNTNNDNTSHPTQPDPGTGGGTVTPPDPGTGGGTVTPPDPGTGGGTVTPPDPGTGGGTVTPPDPGTGGGTVTP